MSSAPEINHAISKLCILGLELCHSPTVDRRSGRMSTGGSSEKPLNDHKEQGPYRIQKVGDGRRGPLPRRRIFLTWKKCLFCIEQGVVVVLLLLSLVSGLRHSEA
ncbi:hypothetical protein FSOLCH5_001362 [Fusarium solani]